MTTKRKATKKDAPQHDKATKKGAAQHDKAATRAVLLEVSSGKLNEPSEYEPGDPPSTPFSRASSQINTDLSIAAHCEEEDDLCLDSETFYALSFSPMYWKLRETFVEEGAAGDPFAFQNAIWRAYNAGLVSPERFIPHSSEVRRERHERFNSFQMEMARQRDQRQP
jgi:hypothetical protein